LREIAEEYPSPNADYLADLIGSLAGVFIEHFCVSQFHDIGFRPTSGLPSRFSRCPTGGCALCAQFPFHLMDCAHHRQEASAGGGACVNHSAAAKQRGYSLWVAKELG
jgi:hypothetical protein